MTKQPVIEHNLARYRELSKPFASYDEANELFTMATVIRKRQC